MRAVIGIITKQNERRDYMAVIDEEAKQNAKELWLQGKKYREISEITGIKESSIKSLASRAWKKEKLQPNK
ncbi:sigma factor-like helix-turn-helix DNA-binding protein, partial [[Clostridium] innocuum]|uniref:sigma factor-like helix-turn-helix DNA-binding protein n=1 Tax=Clostridium innocuum TaxID=1522 RepID=UPI00300E1384